MQSALRQQLQFALKRNELHVHYQPKLHLATGTLQGVEALLRWRTRSNEWVAPTAFVPVLEETGMIDEVGAWLFQRVAEDSAYWQSRGHALVPVAINISPLQLRNEAFLASLLSLSDSLRALGIGFDIELTESALVPDLVNVAAAMEALAAANVRLALDDFGIGYSSMQLLTSLPVQHLKIDRSFVAEMSASHKARAVVEAIIRIGREIGVETIAEGIETEDQLRRLRDLGCDIGQGFYFSPALGREDLHERLALVESLAPERLFIPGGRSGQCGACSNETSREPVHMQRL